MDNLKPKANKLLDFVTHWQQTEPSKNLELCRSIEELTATGEFPPPISIFLKLPLFQELIQMMGEGTPIQADLSPRLQTLIEAFHKLVHLDYNTDPVENPLVQAKVYVNNVQEYLLCVEVFSPYEGNSVEEILSYLFTSIKSFATLLKKLIQDNGHLFSSELLQLIEQPFFLQLCEIQRSNFKPSILEDWYPISIELNLDPKLAAQTKKLSALVKSNAHKLMNQLQAWLAKKRQFYQRNIPIYIPDDLEAKIIQTIDSPTSGQKINERFYSIFAEEKYLTIEAKEETINHKFLTFVHAIWPIKESLYSLVNTYNHFLPERFCDYLLDVIQPYSLDTAIYGKPNHLAVQLVLGIYNVQYDYLMELLSSTEQKALPATLCKRIYDLLPLLLSFMESYYSFRPAASFKTIKYRLEHLYSGEEGIKLHSPEEIKQKLSQTLELLIPSKTISMDDLNVNLQKIVKELHHLASEIQDDIIKNSLFREKLQSLIHMDLPSFSQSWFALGEILGLLIIILFCTEDLFHEKIDSLKGHLSHHPFIQMMFS